MDLEIEPGVDFIQRIREGIGACQVLLVLIGDRWTTVHDGEGRRRLDDPEDFIRLEVESGLQRPEVRVVPVLVQGARMPTRSELPESLADLAYRNAVELSDARWHYDVDRLLATIKQVLEPKRQRPARNWLPAPSRRLGAIGAAALAVGGLAVVLAAGGGDDHGGGARTTPTFDGASVRSAPARGLPDLPAGWPRRLGIGFEDPNQGYTDLTRHLPLQQAVLDTAWAQGDDDGVRATIAAAPPDSLPVFDFWVLGAADDKKALAALDDDETMRAWFGAYERFLREAAATGRRVVANLEPNLWGYAQTAVGGAPALADFVRSGTGEDPRRVRASVRATGRSELSGATDDLAGFAQAVVLLRDKLAPDVLLAWNLRDWGAGESVVDSTAQGDALAALARAGASFYKRLDARFDLATFSVWDPGEPGHKHPWTSKVADRDVTYLKTFARLSRLRVLLQDVPLGDTRNRRGDDRWLTGPDREANFAGLRDAGVIGLIFSSEFDSSRARTFVQQRATWEIALA